VDLVVALGPAEVARPAPLPLAAPAAASPRSPRPAAALPPPGPRALPPLPPPGPPEPPPARAAALIGARPEQLLARLGAPALRREEGGAQIWLYATSACHLDLVLYPEGGGLRVAHAQARAQGMARRSEAACLGEIAARRGGPRPPSASAPAPVA
ncbi:MAG: hypothetical protein ACK44F_17130, partial [Roseococcus sp.]